MTQYYWASEDKIIDPEKDMCPLSDWMHDKGGYVCSLHPNGFPIFLDPSRIHDCDIYVAGDPFGMEDHLNSPFQRARIANTLVLVKHIMEYKQNEVLRILDIGCGHGYITSQIRQTYPQCTISAVDISVSAIERAYKLDNNIDYVVADANDLPYQQAEFDCLILNNIWEHLADPIALLNNAKRVLKTGGFIILSTPSRYRFSNLFRILRGKEVAISEHHVTEYTIGQMIEQLRFAGFKIFRIDSSDTSSRKGSISPVAMISRLVKMVFMKYLRIIGSHHSINSTAFFLAIKNES